MFIINQVHDRQAQVTCAESSKSNCFPLSIDEGMIYIGMCRVCYLLHEMIPKEPKTHKDAGQSTTYEYVASQPAS